MSRQRRWCDAIATAAENQRRHAHVGGGGGDVGAVGEVGCGGVLGLPVTRQVERENARGARERAELTGPVPRTHPRAVQEDERRRGVAAIVAQVRDTLSLDRQRTAANLVI